MSDAPRNELPTRRLNTTHAVEWGGINWLVTVGWDVRGKVAEIFCEGVTAGRADLALTSRLRATAHDLCILISHLLQAGRDVGDLYERLAPSVIRENMSDLTLPCALLKVAIEAQRDHSTVIVQAYEAAARGDSRLPR